VKTVIGTLVAIPGSITKVFIEVFCTDFVDKNAKRCHKRLTFLDAQELIILTVTPIRIGWNKFRQLVPLLTNKDVSLIMTGRLYSSCVRRSMLHGSETWPVRKENVVALQRAEMRMVRWMCGVK